MRQLYLLLLSALIVLSCADNDPTPAVDEQDPDWIRLEIPSGREAYAIAGDIDKTLLVTTWTKAYYTSDGGKTWHESKNFDGPAPGLLVRNDTTFALQASGYNAAGSKVATHGMYFTADYGKSWKNYYQYYNGPALYAIHPIGLALATTGTVYKIRENLTPVSPSSASSYINPSEILKEDAAGQQLIRFPFKHKLINLHLDQNNRLYVAASGGTYQEKNNTFVCCSADKPAIVYVSRKPLP